MSVQRPPGRSAGPGIPECQQSTRGQSQSKAPSKKKGAPKSMVKHEEAEMKGMKYGGKTKKMASGGLAAGHKSADGCATKGKTRGMQVKMAKGGMMKRGKC